MEPKRMRARISKEDLRLSPEVGTSEARETWQAIIDAAWDTTIVAVAFNDMRIPLSRVPATLETLEKEVGKVKDPSTLRIIEEEIKTAIRHFSQIVEDAGKSKQAMERILRAAWNRKVEMR